MRLKRLVALLAIASCTFATGAATVAAPAFASGVTTPSVNLQSAGAQASTAAQTTTVATTATTSTTNGSSSISGSAVIVIVAVVVVFLIGICVYILRDARTQTRSIGRAGQYDIDRGQHSGSKTPQRARKLSAAEKRRRKRGQAPRKRRNK